MAVKHNIEIERGATFTRTLRWKAGKPAVAVDLTGCTIRSQFRSDYDSEDVLQNLTTENGGFEITALGEFQMNISANDTAAFNWDSAVYDIEIVFPTGFVKRFIQGRITVTPESTRV